MAAASCVTMQFSPADALAYRTVCLKPKQVQFVDAKDVKVFSVGHEVRLSIAETGASVCGSS